MNLRFRHVAVIFIASLAMTAIVGCASARDPVIASDKTLVRYSDAAREAFAEGNLAEAIKKNDRALMRAWATDDPYESGSVAYNLAACLVSDADFRAASDWLVDARVELCRAKASTGNTWLLSAEIAMAEDRFEDAARLVDYASRTCPPCEIDPSSCLCGPGSSCGRSKDDACEENGLVKLPCVGKKIQEKDASEDCQHAYHARVELARAKLAAKQFDIVCARAHLAHACECSVEICDRQLQADRHDVAALIHDAEANPSMAGAHRDREIEILRSIGQYREIPDILDAAAESYQAAGRFDLAVDRMIRSARIWLARGDLDRAWQRIRQGGEISQGVGCQAVEIRLALTAHKIQEAIRRDTDADLADLDRKPPSVAVLVRRQKVKPLGALDDSSSPHSLAASH